MFSSESRRPNWEPSVEVFVMLALALSVAALGGALAAGIAFVRRARVVAARLKTSADAVTAAAREVAEGLEVTQAEAEALGRRFEQLQASRGRASTGLSASGDPRGSVLP